MIKKRILICDDEQAIIDLLKLFFDPALYEIFQANDGEEAWGIFQKQDLDLAIVDVMMPKLSGLELIERIKERVPDMPVLILSALDSLVDKLKGYNIGADDYITKPFEPLEVLAKVKARLKFDPADSVISLGDMVLDLYQCLITVAGHVHELTKVEFEVLKLFMESPNRVFTKEQIYQAGWDDDFFVNDSSIRVIINRIRSIIGKDRIQTIRGLGYRLKL